VFRQLAFIAVLGLLIVALQIFFAIHAVRNGKDNIWLWLIILAPGIGCAIYFFTQFAPASANSRTVRDAKNSLLRSVDPKRELRRRMEMLEIANTIENRIALADECVEAGMFDTAIELLNDSLVGMHKTDAVTMERLARAHFANGEPGKVVDVLDELKAANPDYRSADGHLLYARALEAQGKNDSAVREYEVLRSSYPGEEARIRYAQLLRKIGDSAGASKLFEESLVRAKRAPKFYRTKEREWLRIAERGGSG